MEYLKQYISRNFEQFFVLVILTFVAFVNYYLPHKVAFINFYFLPVIMAGYFLGLRRSVLGAVLCILLVIIYASINPHLFVLPHSRQDLFLHILAWGGFLILAGAVVGRQHEKLALEIRQTRQLNEQLVDSIKNVQDARTTAILGLAKLAECRDQDTGAHLERIREYSKILAEELAGHPKYQDYITPDYVNDIYYSSILHDVGKVGVSDAILLKPSKLTEEEFELVKQHTVIGGDALKAADNRIQGESFLTLGKEIAYFHHERWDGTGYPRGLRGEEIPLSARIVALADIYDALTSERPYKKAFSHGKAMEIIQKENGDHLDPVVMESFLKRESDFNSVRRVLQDGNA